MKYKAIIFDMDGTIVDSNHIWKQTSKDLMKSKKPDITEEQMDKLEKEMQGLALHASCALIKEWLELHEHDLHDLISEKTQRALELYKQEINFILGFENFFKKVKEEQLKTGIATNADNHTLEVAINKLNLRNYFGEHIYNISHVNNKHKPHPDLYLHVANQLQIDPKECVAIEDTHHGIKAAVDAGMFCIGINTGKDRDALKDAHLIIDHYDEICLNRLLKKNKQ